MTTPFPYVSGADLTAAQLNAITELPVNDKTASYTLTADEAGERVIMNSASATTITVNTNLFTAGQVIYITNKGAGVCTVTAGTATVSTTGSLALAQYASGVLYCISAGVFIFEAYGVAASAGGFVFISSTTIGTGVASVAVSNCFSSTYDSYFVDVSGAAGNGNVVGLQLGATTTGYYGGGISVNSAGTVTGRGNNNAASFTNILPETDNQGFGIQIQIMNPNLAKRTVIVATSSSGAGSYFSGALADTTAYTGFTLTTTGTLTGGAIRVYGIAKS